MNEGLKAKLKEKLGAAVSDEDLDKVAGGTQRENEDILVAMSQLDPQGVQAVVVYAKNFVKTKSGSFQEGMADGTEMLLKKHFGDNLTAVTFEGDKYSNDYWFNGQGISHKQLINMINQKALEKDGWDFM